MSTTTQSWVKAEQLSTVASILFVAAAREWITSPYYFGPHTRLAIDFLEDTYTNVCKQFTRLDQRSKNPNGELSSMAKSIVELSLYIGIIFHYQGGFYLGPITNDLDTKTLRKFFNQPNIRDLHTVWNRCSAEAPNRQMPSLFGVFPPLENVDVVSLVRKHKDEHPTVLYGETKRIVYHTDQV